MTAVTAAQAHEELLAAVREQLAGEPVQRELARLWASGEREPDARPLYRELGRLGLLAINWPEEYGGRGRSLEDASVVVQELVRAGVPDTLHVNTIQIVGLFLLLAGTPEQKARYLPAFASGEAFASVLYTEPGSGSDLASLRAAAVEDDGGFRLNGTKVYSLKSDVTDVALAAARTSDEATKYAGITLFLVDLDADGVRRSVVPSVADEQFHRVELDDVRVSREAVVGEVGEGWPLLSQALAIERTGLDYLLKAERWLAAAVDGIDEASADGGLVIEIGRFGGAIEATRALTWSVLDELGEGVVNEPRAAAAKYFSSELAQDVALWAPCVHGAGFAARGASAESRRVLESAFREAPGLTLSAGTSEMMLQIVAGSAFADDDVAEDGERDEVLSELRGALRNALRAVQGATDPHAPPASHGADSPAWEVLLRFEAPKFELPAELGGLGLGLESAAIVLEELGRAGFGSPYAGVALSLHALRAAGRDDDALARSLADGATTAAPAGFDASPARSSSNEGVRRLSGTAVAAGDADLFSLAAEVDGSTVLAIVPRERLARDPDALPDGELLLSLDGISVDDLELVAPLEADDELMTAARVRQAAYLTGIAAGAHAEAVRHAGRRTQFDEPLLSFQSIAFRLADAHVRLDALRALVRAAAGLAEAEEDTPTRAREALALAAETALGVVRTSAQICGARGMTAETSLHRFYRLARMEAVRFGLPSALWLAAGEARVRMGR